MAAAMDKISVAMDKMSIARDAEEKNREKIAKYIISKRDLFQSSLKKHKGPPIVTTIFRNHPDRHSFVKERDKELYDVRSPRYPPPPPKFTFTSANEVYLAIEENFKNKLFLPHDDLAKVLCLKEEVCGELAMEEMLQHQSPLYSEDIEVQKTSQYLDPDAANWFYTPPCKCKYMVDFSVILPEGLISTATVSCPSCCYYTETFLPSTLIGTLRPEMTAVVNTIKYCGDPTKKKSVARIPMQIIKSHGCFVSDGILGAMPLTGCPLNPSVLVRTRLGFYCNDFSPFGKVVHKNDDYVLLDVVP